MDSLTYKTPAGNSLKVNGRRGQSMSTQQDLERMKSAWERLGVDRQFPRVHHFVSDSFSSRACGFATSTTGVAAEKLGKRTGRL